LVVGGGLLVDRAWCRYACPLGGFLGLFNKLTPVRLRRSETACSNCNLCNRICPMDLKIANVDAVSDTTCNRCLECVDSCPRPEALQVQAGRKPLKGWAYGLLAGTIFGGVILLSMATGTWEASAAGREPVVDSATQQLSTEDIRGWRTLKEIIDLWGVPQEVLYREMGLDASTPTSTQLKQLEGHTNAQGLVVNTGFVRDLVGRWQRGELK
ncbi:MAG TPA: 4Fe-4S binding protein, partial [Symbiobacteriaceae bacterium]|nr:4Fe-4S binding protein [Symbiobacteriaceae bacterium]